MNFLTIEQLENMELDDIFKHLDEIRQHVANHEISFEEVPKDITYRSKIELKDLSDFFVFEHENNRYQFPKIQEQEEFEGVSFLGHEPLPIKGFYWSTSAVEKKYEFGLLYQLFELKKISPASDLKYLGDRTVVKQEYDMYFDFEKGHYIHVKSKNVDDYEEFNRRRLLYSTVLQRLEKKNDQYKQNLEKSVKILGLHTNRTMTDIPSLTRLFSMAKQFIDENMKFLRSKVLLTQITEEHYLTLKKEMETISNQVPMRIQWLKEFQEKGYKSIANYGDFEDKLVEKSRLIFDFQQRVVQLFGYRDVGSVHFKPKDGFIGLNEHRLFENLPQIEVESSLAVHSETRNKREQQKRELFLQWHKEKERESR